MSSLNQCNFIGYMADAADTRTMPNGDMVANFRIACGEKWKDKKTGESKEKTEWVNCVVWRGLAEVVAQYGVKGMQVFVSGKFTTRKWTKDGVDRWTSEIQVNDFKMLGKKSDNESQQRTPARTDTTTTSTEGFDDDIPF